MLRSTLKRIPLAVSVYQYVSTRLGQTHVLIRRMLKRRAYSRAQFESIFQRKIDPWNYTSPHQEERLKILMEQIPENGNLSLEVGCAEGAFTAAFAGRTRRLVALDISIVALERARVRCNSIKNVSFVQADVLHLPFSSSFDRIVCAGVLGYFPEPDLFGDVSRSVQLLLNTKGYLIMEERWETTDGSRSGRETYEHFASSSKLKCRNLLHHKDYAIAVFQRVD